MDLTGAPWAGNHDPHAEVRQLANDLDWEAAVARDEARRLAGMLKIAPAREWQEPVPRSELAAMVTAQVQLAGLLRREAYILRHQE